VENSVTKELYTGLEKERARRGGGGGRREATGRGIGLKEKKERGQRKWSELAKVYDRKGGHDRSSKQVSWPRLERPVPPSFSSTTSSSFTSSFFSLSFSPRVLSPWPLTRRMREVISSRITHVTIPDTAMTVDRGIVAEWICETSRVRLLLLVKEATPREAQRRRIRRRSKSRFRIAKKTGATKLP